MNGLGSMLHELGGGSPKSACNYYGRKITKAKFEGDAMFLTFDNSVRIKIWDNGQSCCENRFMTCDDDLTTLEGKILVEIAVKYTDVAKEDEYDNEHEIAFLDIKTNDNVVTFATHNEHNGYYGGFGLSIDEVGNE